MGQASIPPSTLREPSPARAPEIQHRDLSSSEKDALALGDAAVCTTPVSSTLPLVQTNRSAPLGPVIPELAYPDVAAAVDWLVQVLGFVERVRIGPGHRAQLSFGEGSLIVADVGHGRMAPTGEDCSQSVMLRVEDVASLCDRVRKQGGTIVREPCDFSYGERQCTVLDPAGHRWTLSQTLHDVAPEQWGGIAIDAR
jgi:uncharacterized glyoxalase superfamily protein PhnB